MDGKRVFRLPKSLKATPVGREPSYRRLSQSAGVLSSADLSWLISGDDIEGKEQLAKRDHYHCSLERDVFVALMLFAWFSVPVVSAQPSVAR